MYSDNKENILPPTKLKIILNREGSIEDIYKMDKLYIKFVSPNAKSPSRGSKNAAGLDIHSVEKGVIKAGERGCIDTGIQMSIPDGFYGRMAPRS